MENVFNPSDREALSRRLDALQATSTRQWGTMAPAQALGHLSIMLESACGDRHSRRMLIGWLLAWLVKSSALGAKPFPKGAPTSPEFVVADEPDFLAERQRLAILLERFCAAGPSSAEGRTHPFFGRLGGEEWGRLVYKHVDHHLRQFGA